MARNFFIDRDSHDKGDRLLLYLGQRLVVRGDELTWSYEEVARLVHDERPSIFIDRLADVRYLAVDLPEDFGLPDDAELISLRQILVEGRVGDFRIPGLGNQLASWYRMHRYCGACGGVNRPHPRERAMECPRCNATWYPRINPCVIVLVSHEGKLLLARHARYRMNLYSCLAGFIEAGETPELTIHREIREEAGIEVKNLRYIRSQSWPFPSQLMLGFHAEYEAGELHPDPDEIDDIQWFSPDNLPPVPSARISVAGYLIQSFLEQTR